MLGNSLDIAYGSTTITLNRLTMDGFTSSFGASTSTADYLLEIKHAFPKAGKTGVEQHLAKLTVTEYATVDGQLSIAGQFSAHVVIKTNVGVESDSKVTLAFNALKSAMTPDNLAAILQRRT